MEVVVQPSLLEILMRGGVVALSLFLMITILNSSLNRILAISGALFEAGVAAFTLSTSPWFEQQLGVAAPPIKLLAVSAPIFFWIYAQALFNDRYRFRLYHLLPFMLILPPHVYHYSEPLYLIVKTSLMCGLAQLVSAALFLHVPFIAFQHLKADLIQSRRYFRVACGTLIPIVGIYFTARNLMALYFGAWIEDGTFIQALILFLVTLAFTLWFTECCEDLLIGDGVQKAPPAGLRTIDAIELKSLQALINEGICLEEGLTIGRLAERMNIPEHRLRVLINKGLGYRNFPAFLNDHRVELAKQWLTDPERGREQIIQIAYGLGYASLAPFNRAFRERVGVSPTQFRAEAL